MPNLSWERIEVDENTKTFDQQITELLNKKYECSAIINALSDTDLSDEQKVKFIKSFLFWS